MSGPNAVVVVVSVVAVDLALITQTIGFFIHINTCKHIDFKCISALDLGQLLLILAVFPTSTFALWGVYRKRPLFLLPHIFTSVMLTPCISVVLFEYLFIRTNLLATAASTAFIILVLISIVAMYRYIWHFIVALNMQQEVP